MKLLMLPHLPDADASDGDADIEQLSSIMETMTDLRTVKPTQTAEELNKFAVSA